MRKKIILIFVILFVISAVTICKSNTGDRGDNTKEQLYEDDESNSFYIEGCIQKVGDNIFLVNNSRMLLHSNTISIDELIIGNNYRVEYKRILESNPPIVDIISYKEISKDYCNDELFEEEVE